MINEGLHRAGSSTAGNFWDRNVAGINKKCKIFLTPVRELMSEEDDISMSDTVTGLNGLTK